MLLKSALRLVPEGWPQAVTDLPVVSLTSKKRTTSGPGDAFLLAQWGLWGRPETKGRGLGTCQRPKARATFAKLWRRNPAR